MTKERQVTVLGAGYSGLTTAAELTLRGFKVSLDHFLLSSLPIAYHVSQLWITTSMQYNYESDTSQHM